MKSAAAAAFALFAPAALAWPVDNIVDVEPGGEKFQRLGAVDWFEVENPAVAQVEWLESGELLVTGKAKGRTLVLLYAQGTAAVWRIRVGEKPAGANADAVKKACGGSVELGARLTGTVKTDACRKALLAALEADTWRAQDLDLTFELPVMQSQLQSIQTGLDKVGLKVQAKYVGAGLVLEGTLTPPEKRRALWEIFRRTVGRLAFDDRLD